VASEIERGGGRDGRLERERERANGDEWRQVASELADLALFGIVRYGKHEHRTGWNSIEQHKTACNSMEEHATA